MINIAIMGFGTIGSGVFDIVTGNGDMFEKNTGKKVCVKHILDLRSFPGSPAESLLTHDFSDILNDPEISIVVETMGGVEPAFSFEMQLLAAGKSVVTSNKELVEKKGPELFAAAKANNVNFYFEASVGGGIPIIRNLIRCVTADHVVEISGILNGTTNYILTQMSQVGVSYDEALKAAQGLGYAEKDPTADVEGHDAGRKIAILASIVMGKKVSFADLYTEGITGVTKADMDYAKELGMAIKLVAGARFDGGGVSAKVTPMLVPATDMLSSVNDVFNAVSVQGDMVDTLTFIGRGAGSHATASAVCADVIEAVNCAEGTVYEGWSNESAKMNEASSDKHAFLVRANGNMDDLPQALAALGGGAPVTGVCKDEFGVITTVMSEAEMDRRLEKVNGYIKRIRIK